MRLSPIFSLRISRPCFLASAPYLRQRYDDLQIMEARGVAWSRSSPGLLDAHRFAGDRGPGGFGLHRRGGDQSGEDVAQQEIGALERRCQVVRVRSDVFVCPGQSRRVAGSRRRAGLGAHRTDAGLRTPAQYSFFRSQQIQTMITFSAARGLAGCRRPPQGATMEPECPSPFPSPVVRIRRRMVMSTGS
jgi:hypothetical protein